MNMVNILVIYHKILEVLADKKNNESCKFCWSNIHFIYSYIIIKKI